MPAVPYPYSAVPSSLTEEETKFWRYEPLAAVAGPSLAVASGSKLDCSSKTAIGNMSESAQTVTLKMRTPKISPETTGRYLHQSSPLDCEPEHLIQVAPSFPRPFESVRKVEL